MLLWLFRIVGIGGTAWVGRPFLLFVDACSGWAFLRNWEKLTKTPLSFHLGTGQKHFQKNYLGKSRAEITNRQVVRAHMWHVGKAAQISSLADLIRTLNTWLPHPRMKALHIKLLALLGSFPCHNLSLLSLTDTQTQLDCCGVCRKKSPFLFIYILKIWMAVN